jgi:CheY-like chemotaxis protein
VALPWKILIVDDEPDVHAITQLALKRKTWRNRPFELVSARSGKEAREVLARAGDFQVALVDVVMETDHAGLDLCRHIRETYPRSLRIVLRTGQPGVAPEDAVLNDFDIDFYIAKSEATAEKLYSVVRAGLRASQDLATILAVKTQLQGFTRLMQGASTLEQLVEVMDESLKFLESKFAARIAFLSSVTPPAAASTRPPIWNKRDNIDYQRAWQGLLKLRAEAAAADTLHAGSPLGLSGNTFLMLFPVLTAEETRGRGVHEPRAGLLDKLGRAWRGVAGGESAAEPVDAGIAVEFASETSDLNRGDFLSDLRLFLENWKIAYATLCLQEDVARARLTRERELGNPLAR